MRLAVFSDIHGNLTAFEAMLADFESVGDVDLIWCLGDLAVGGTRPNECLTKLRQMHDHYGKDKFKVIGGNTDRYLVTGKRSEVPAAKDEDGFKKRQQSFAQRDAMIIWTLQSLDWENYEFLSKTIGRETATSVEGYGRVIGFHAIPGDDEPVALLPDSPDEEAMDALLDRQGKLALAGHTHQVMDRAVGSWRVINPGSVGFSFTQYGVAEWALITIENGEAQVDFRNVPYGVDAFIEDIQTVNHPTPDNVLGLLNRAKNNES